MVLTDRDRDELHNAMVEYLETQGLSDAAASLKDTFTKHGKFLDKDGALERKWGIVRRLNKKNLELEARVKAQEEELRDLSDPTKSGKGGASSGHPWVPASPYIAQFRGHRDTLSAVAFHPTESLCFSASEDGTIRVWDLETKRHVRTLRDHTDNVSVMAIEPVNGALMASGGNDQMIKVYDTSNDQCECVRTLHGHEDSVTALAWIANSDNSPATKLISASRAGDVRQWDATRGSQLSVYQHGDWVMDLTVAFPLVAIADKNEELTLFNCQTNQPTKSLGRLHTNAVQTVAFSSEKADAIYIEANGTPDQKLFLKEHKRKLEVAKMAAESGSNPNAVAEVHAAYQPRFLASGARDKNIILTDVTTGNVAHTFEAHENWVRGMVFTPSGQHLLSCSDDGTVIVHDFTTRRVVKKIEAGELFVTCIALHPQGKPLMITGGSDQVANVWMCK